MKEDDGFITIDSVDEIPDFADEDEEAEYWATHGPSLKMLRNAQPLPEHLLPRIRPRTRPIAIRFDEEIEGRLKRLATRKRKGYQTLLKQFVVERLYEEEKREGIIPRRRQPARR